MSKTTTFNGAVSDNWSASDNWLNGIPVDGDNVGAGHTESFDNIQSLSLSSLDLSGLATNSPSTVVVTGTILTIGTLIVDYSSKLYAAPIFNNSSGPTTVIVESITQTRTSPIFEPLLAALGNGTLVNESVNDPGLNYNIGNGGTVIVDNTVNGSSQFNFITLNQGTTSAGGIGTVALKDPDSTQKPSLGELGVGDTLELPGSSAVVTFPSQNQLVAATNVGTYTFRVTWPGNGLQPPNFGYTTHSDSSTGLEAITFYCFCAGSHIATPAGEKAIENLRIGDVVTTTDGRERPVRWIGRNTVTTRFGDPLRFAPIRIRAGAIGDGLPARNLLLSPDHAIFVNGILVHAGALVNGTSIIREVDLPAQFVYYHIELDEHCLILAEGLAAETFVDNVDRMRFDNWEEHRTLFGDGKAIREMEYPRAMSHRQVPPSIRVMLDARARNLVTEQHAA
jgi:hypothetical protein